jgi:hypothetical protein
VEAFQLNQRVAVTNVTRIAKTRGEETARWLLDRPGVVLAPAKSAEGAWVRLDESLPPALRCNYPDKHPLGRNVLLFPWECQPAHDRGYAPFHRLEFAATLHEACARFDQAFLLPARDPTRPERSWWRDVTQERRAQSAKGLWEFVYRFGVEQRKVSLLVYSSVSTATEWSRPASDDAIRFVHEVRHCESPLYLDTGTRVNRTGMSPLIRVAERVLELLEPDYVRDLAKRTWSPTPWQRRR